MLRTIFRPLAVATAMLFASAPVQAQLEDGQLIDDIQESGSIRVGMAEHAPAQFKDPISGEWKGLNVDMANDLAEVLGVELEIVASTWSSLIPGLQAGKYNLIMSDLYATPERALVVNFTDTYMTQSNALVVREGLNIDDYKALNDPQYTFAAISGTASAKSVDSHFPKAEKKELVTDNEFAHLLELAAGRVDAVLYEHTTIKRFLESNPGAGIKMVSGVKLDVQGASYAIQPGDQHSLNFLNVWISYLERQGVIEDLRQKWYIEYLSEQ
jgi:ABC-type amino acid transport substrate-binding protein